MPQNSDYKWIYGNIVEGVKYVLSEYKRLVSLFAVAAVLGNLWGYWSLPWWNDLPRWLQLGITIMALLYVPGNYLAKKLVDKYFEWTYEDVYAVDGEVFGIKHYYVSEDLWEDKIVEDGQVYTKPENDKRYVRHFDFDEEDEQIRVEGPWMGESDDVDLMTRKSEIAANRGRLRTWAQIGQGLYSKLPSITGAIESAYWTHMSDDTLERKAKHPHVVQSEVTQDVERLVESIEIPDKGEGEADAEEMMEEAVEEEVGEIPEPDGGEVDE